MEDQTWFTQFFQPARLLGVPSVIAPPEISKIAISTQFIIPGLYISKDKKEDYFKLINKCIGDVWNSDIADGKNSKTGALASLVTVAHYIDSPADESVLHQTIFNKSRILIERFLGILSFCAGIKLAAKNIVNTITTGSNFKAILPVVGKAESSKINFHLPEQLCSKEIPSDEIFTALFWLRRGLAENDPIDTFNALAVCLQILARTWSKIKAKSIEKPSATSQFKDYIIEELKGNPDIVDKVWRKRNAISGHGNKINIDADDFVELTELRFEAANWAYKGINLALGLSSEDSLRPNQSFFITDALMNLD